MQPAIELQSSFVDVAIRPATAEEIPLVVGLRHEVFSAGAGPETVEEAAEWKARSLDNLLNRRAKGAVLLVATARDRRWGPGAAPLLVGYVGLLCVLCRDRDWKRVALCPCCCSLRWLCCWPTG